MEKSTWEILSILVDTHLKSFDGQYLMETSEAFLLESDIGHKDGRQIRRVKFKLPNRGRLDTSVSCVCERVYTAGGRKLSVDQISIGLTLHTRQCERVSE